MIFSQNGNIKISLMVWAICVFMLGPLIKAVLMVTVRETTGTKRRKQNITKVPLRANFFYHRVGGGT